MLVDKKGVVMKKEEFRNYLYNRMSYAPASNAISRCNRVEKYYGDLDFHYDQDKCHSLLYGDLELININGDRYTGIASIKNAIRRYCDFCEHLTKETCTIEKEENSNINLNTTKTNKNDMSFDIVIKILSCGILIFLYYYLIY